MDKVFIAGSITIKSLPTAFVERLNSLIETGLDILIGDANGVDSAVQHALYQRDVPSVTVYCSGPHVRNNVGNWTVRHIETRAEPGTKAFFTAKDVAMAVDCTLGFMLWDSKSTGTLTNIIELVQRKKKCVVYVNKVGVFKVVKDAATLRALTEFMSLAALEAADKKMGLLTKVRSLENNTMSLPF